MICPNCGRQLDPAQEKFCVGCGLNLFAGTDKDPVKDAPPVAAPAVTREKKTTWSTQQMPYIPYSPGAPQEETEPEERLPLFTQIMTILASAAGGALMLMILGCLFLREQDQIVDVYIIFSVVAAALAFLTIRMGLKNAVTNARKTLFHQGMLVAGGVILLAGLFIPTALSIFYLLPGLIALGFAGWCLMDILKVPKLRRSKELDTLMIATFVVGGLALLLPGAKFVLYLLGLFRSFTDTFSPRRWVEEIFDYLFRMI